MFTGSSRLGFAHTDGICSFIIYTPPLHVVFGGSFHLLPLYWLIPCAFGVLLLAWASLRVVILRRGVEDARVKDIRYELSISLLLLPGLDL